MATSDVEQAVCTLMLGPRRLSRYDSRVARKSLSLPVWRSRNQPTFRTSSGFDSRLNIRYALAPQPAKTPTLPAKPAGVCPAVSIASHAVSQVRPELGDVPRPREAPRHPDDRDVGLGNLRRACVVPARHQSSPVCV